MVHAIFNKTSNQKNAIVPVEFTCIFNDGAEYWKEISTMEYGYISCVQQIVLVHIVDVGQFPTG